MDLQLRAGRAEDAERCGDICFRAFKDIAEKHAFPPDFPAPDVAIGLMSALLTREDVFSVVGEVAGEVVGSNFLWEGDVIAGVGPITVDPVVQNGSVGRALMRQVLVRAKERGFSGVRLVQAAYHARSLSLYTKLGFDVREPLVAMQGEAIGKVVAGRRVRPATLQDMDACCALYAQLHGFERRHELREAIGSGAAAVAEFDGRITGYTTGVGFFGHTAGECNDDLQALIAAAPAFSGPGFLLPIRNATVFRWCLEHGLRVVQPMTLMSIGLYNEPKGGYLPSILL